MSSAPDPGHGASVSPEIPQRRRFSHRAQPVLPRAALATVVGAGVLAASTLPGSAWTVAAAVLLILLVLAQGTSSVFGLARSRGSVATLIVAAVILWAAMVWGSREASADALPAALAVGLILLMAHQLLRPERSDLVRALAAGSWALALMGAGSLLIPVAQEPSRRVLLVALAGLAAGSLAEWGSPSRIFLAVQGVLAALAGVAVGALTGSLSWWQPVLALLVALVGSAIRRVGSEGHAVHLADGPVSGLWWALALAAAGLCAAGTLAYAGAALVLA